MNQSLPGIEIAANDRVLEVSFANPPDNRITAEMVFGLDQAIDRFEDPAFDVLLLKGVGRSFSKGFDVAAVRPDQPAELRRMLVLSNAVFSRLARSSKLTVAAIHGACMGGGLELALACHFRLAAEKTRLGLPEVWINLVPGLGGMYRLARLVGQAKALELVALGDLINADEALRLNLVNRVFPREDFAERAGSFIKALLVADQGVIREIIRLVGLTATLGEEDGIREAIESFARLLPCSPKSSN
jgi:enoyl-CoA hydratase